MMEDAKLSKVFSNTFTIFGKNFGKLFVGGIIAYAVVFIAMIPLLNWMFQSLNIYDIGYIRDFDLQSFLNGILPGLIVWVLVLLVVSIAADAFSGAYMTGVIKPYIAGEKLSWGRSFGQAWKPFGKTILTELAFNLIVFVLFAIIGFITTALIGMAMYTYNMMIVVFGILFLLLLELAVGYFLLHFVLRYAVTVYEGRSGFGALIGSFGLFVKGGYGRNLGHVVLIGLIVSAGAGILEVPIMLGIFVGFLSPVSGILITGIFMIVLMSLMRAVILPLYTLEYNHSVKKIELNTAKEE